MQTLSEANMKKRLQKLVLKRQPQLYNNSELGTVRITERAVERFHKALPNFDTEAIKHEVAMQAFRLWSVQLQWMEIGQAEMKFKGFALHVAIDDAGRVYADVEPWFPY